MFRIIQRHSFTVNPFRIKIHSSCILCIASVLIQEKSMKIAQQLSLLGYPKFQFVSA